MKKITIGLDNSSKNVYSIVVFKMIYARVLELADKHVSEACVARRTGSTPVSRTIMNLQKRHEMAVFFILKNKLRFKLVFRPGLTDIKMGKLSV